MQFYVLLGAATLIIAILGVIIQRRTKMPVFVLAVGFLYYWSLVGGWVIVSGKTAGAGEEDLYLYHKLFPIHLDDDYWWSLVMYALFVISFELAILHFARRAAPEEISMPPGDRLVVSHARIVTMCGAAGFIGYLLVKDSIAEAAAMSISAYGHVCKATEYFTLHQIFNQTALLPLALGFGVFLCGSDGRYVVGRRTLLTGSGYAAVAAGLFLLNMILGQRGEVVAPIILAVSFYLINAKRPSPWLLGGLVGSAVAGVWLVTVARGGLSFEGAHEGVWLAAGKNLFDTFRGVETVAAHFSMYGVIHKGVPLLYGLSIAVLLLSVIPRAIWPGRPSGAYEYYAAHVGALEGQGYTLHHATGWYMNFGAIGVFFGGASLGWIAAKLFNALAAPASNRSHLYRVFIAIGFASFTAKLPLMIRDGIEGYKSLVVEAFLIPALVIALSSTKVMRRQGRPVVIGSRAFHYDRTLALPRGAGLAWAQENPRTTAAYHRSDRRQPA